MGRRIRSGVIASSETTDSSSGKSVAHVLHATLVPATREDLRRRDAMSLQSVVRLAPGVRPADVTRKVATLAARLTQLEPEQHRHFTLGAVRLAGMDAEDSGTKELVFAFFFVAALVVPITCTNVSALLLGRAVARRREIGVRFAMGASRFRIIRQMLTEALILGLAGALVGIALYTVAIKIAYATIPEVIYGLDPQPATFFWAAVFALIATVTFGLAPALHASKADIGEVIKNSGTQSIRRGRLQAGFVVIQLACSIPALVVTSLVLIDMRRGMSDSVAPASVVTMFSDVMGRPPSAGATYARIRQRLAAIPGVQAVSVEAPFAVVYGENEPPTFGAGPRIQQYQVTRDYFTALGIPLLRGRTIDAGDDHPGSVAAVVDEAVAARLWPGEDAIGKQLVRRSEPDGAITALTVIGVAGRAPYDDVDRAPRVYVPFATGSSQYGVHIAVRTVGESRPFIPAIRAAIREVEPLAAVGSVSTLAEQYEGRRREAMLANLAAFAVGAAALLLASLGLYAIIAFAVAQRTREIGIRLAVGASASAVVHHFFKGGLKVTAIGLAIGLPLTVAGILVVKASLIGFSVRNITAVMLVVPVLILIAALASWLPARRAGRVDPLIALRSE
jgi:predicted permease